MIIGNYVFSSDYFTEFITKIFAEGFTHSSLSFEESFKESREFSRKLKEFISPENVRFARLLEESNKPEDKALLEQRRTDVLQVLTLFYHLPMESQVNEYNLTVPGVGSFKDFFDGAVRPYRNTNEVRAAAAEGKLTGEPYEVEPLSIKVTELKDLILGKIKADMSAKLLKKANIEAFLYALKLDNIDIKEIININTLVNSNQGIHEGFKTTNNAIGGSAEFETCPKEYVNQRITELLYKYNKEWAAEIPPLIGELSTDEDIDAYLLAMFEREAKFHIEFERIHPFEDGNGRTGRIILNQHLIKNGLAPISITREMRDVYIDCINKKDHKTLGRLFYMLSSNTLNMMVATYREKKGYEPEEVSKQELGEPEEFAKK